MWGWTGAGDPTSRKRALALPRHRQFRMGFLRAAFVAMACAAVLSPTETRADFMSDLIASCRARSVDPSGKTRPDTALAVSRFGSWRCSRDTSSFNGIGDQPNNPNGNVRLVMEGCNSGLSSGQRSVASCELAISNNKIVRSDTAKALSRDVKIPATITIKDAKQKQPTVFSGHVLLGGLYDSQSRQASVFTNQGHKICSGKQIIRRAGILWELNCFERKFDTGFVKPKGYNNIRGFMSPLFEVKLKQGRSYIIINTGV